MTISEWEKLNEKELDKRVALNEYQMEYGNLNDLEFNAKQIGIDVYKSILSDPSSLKDYSVACALDESNKFTYAVLTARGLSQGNEEYFMRAMRNMVVNPAEKMESMDLNFSTLMNIDQEELFKIVKANNGLGGSEYDSITYTGEVSNAMQYFNSIRAQLSESNSVGRSK